MLNEASGNEAGLKMKVSTERQGGAESQRERAFLLRFLLGCHTAKL